MPVVKGAVWVHLPIYTLDAQRFTAQHSMPCCALHRIKSARGTGTGDLCLPVPD